jgi:hypothetical protein
MFLNTITDSIGPGWEYNAIGSTKDRSHLFVLSGAGRFGLLIDTQEVAVETGEFVSSNGYLFKTPASGCVLIQELKAFRWDPWLYASHTGDDTVLKLSDKKRRQLRDERNREIAAAKDCLLLKFVPLDQAPSNVLGLPLTELLGLFAGPPGEGRGRFRVKPDFDQPLPDELIDLFES